VHDDDLENQFEKWQLQLRKGVLIYMVLVLLDQDEMYGYALISALAKKLETDMAEGTIYPLLNRMVRRGIVTFDWRIMESGPARKYYQISDSGRELLSRMHDYWQSVNTSLQGSTND
jgi:PadR family transcriptional regulator PadR